MKKKNQKSDKNSVYKETTNGNEIPFDSKKVPDIASPDKYLALEQKGITYTKNKNHTSNSDYLKFNNDENTSDKWKTSSKNILNANAFNQDDYILKDNIDLDEDQSQSISSDIDTNTIDER